MEGDAPQFLIPPAGYANPTTPFFYPQPQITSVNPIPYEIYVSPDGSDGPGVVGSVTAPFATITNAMGYITSLPGAPYATNVICIFVAPGVYAGNFSLLDNMYLIGATVNTSAPALPTQSPNAVSITDLVTVTATASNDPPIVIQNIQLQAGVRVRSVFYDTSLTLVNCAVRSQGVLPAIDIDPADQDVVSTISARNCIISTTATTNLALVRGIDSEKGSVSFDGCQFSTEAEEGSIIELTGNIDINNCSLVNNQSGNNLSPLIIASSGATLVPAVNITNSTLKYTDVSTTDTGGNKLAIRFNAPTQPITATMTGCTISVYLGGGNTDIVKNIGAATVTLTQSANSCLLDGRDIDTTNLTLPTVAFLQDSPSSVYQATYYKSVVQNLTSGATDMTFDLEAAWNNDNGYITHTPGSADFTVVQAGLYQLEFNATVLANGATWATTSNKGISIDITRSPTAEQVVLGQSAFMASGTNYLQNTTSTFDLAAGDVINCRISNTFTGGPAEAQCVQNTIDLNTFFTWRYVSTGGGAGVTSLAGLTGAVTLSSPGGSISITPNGQDIQIANPGILSLAGEVGIVTLSSPDATINITAAGGDIALSAIAPVSSVGGKTGTVTFGVGSGIGIDYGTVNNDPITISNSGVLSATGGAGISVTNTSGALDVKYIGIPPVLQAAGTTALTPTNNNTIYILTSGTTQDFDTTGLGAGDAGKVWYVKNGSSADIDIEANGVAIAGQIAILHNLTTNVNSSMQIIYWDGTTLTMY
jgi:hypothetical protein